MKSEDKLRPATEQDEEFAKANFDPSLSYEEWAAFNVHEFAMFSFHERQYRDYRLNEWIKGLADWLFKPDLPERLRAAREKYLTPEQIAEFEEFENEEL